MPSGNNANKLFVDERDARTRSNLWDYHNGTTPEHTQSYGKASSADKLIDAMFEGIDAPPQQPTDSKKELDLAARTDLVKNALRKLEIFHQSQKSSLRERWNRDKRAEYAAHRLAEGKTVRPYRHHPKIEGESPEERERRLRREGDLRRAGKDESSVRPYQDLAHLTDEEKQARKKKQDAEAGARRTLKRKADAVRQDRRHA